MLLLWVISHQIEHLHTILSSGRGLTRLGRNILCDLIYIFFLNKTNYFKLRLYLQTLETGLRQREMKIQTSL